MESCGAGLDPCSAQRELGAGKVGAPLGLCTNEGEDRREPIQALCRGDSVPQSCGSALTGPRGFSFLENTSRDGMNPQDPVYRSGWSSLCRVGSAPRARRTDGRPLSTRGQKAEGQGRTFLEVTLGVTGGKRGAMGTWAHQKGSIGGNSSTGLAGLEDVWDVSTSEEGGPAQLG